MKRNQEKKINRKAEKEENAREEVDGVEVENGAEEREGVEKTGRGDNREGRVKVIDEFKKIVRKTRRMISEEMNNEQKKQEKRKW